MQNKTEILTPETSYHVYNRANGSEKLFLSADNYFYILQKYQEHISPVADTFCYCLMPNHFHFLIRIKSVAALLQVATQTGFETLSGLEREKALSTYLSKQFSNLFNSYTQAFNKQNKRKGGLFMTPFKRKKITEQSYLLKLIHYIHSNPVAANLCAKPNQWPYSSYASIISNKASFLNTEEILIWFETKENFIHFHSRVPETIQP